MAKRFPDARVTAIDISDRALAYAAERCRGLGIDFRMLDLHEATSIGRRFDLIACCGVLHHLPDAEDGWAKLVDALTPGGVMKVMVYSRVARLRVAAARAYIADLVGQPVDENVLREVRRRLIETAPPFVTDFRDFYSLSGVHDLLLNPYEDPFDVPRIARGLDRLRLELLGFKLPTRADGARYRREHPEDPLLRNVDAWKALEKTRPLLFSGMYEFWCRALPQ
jgi:SAM-dependent methyltransferase